MPTTATVHDTIARLCEELADSGLDNIGDTLAVAVGVDHDTVWDAVLLHHETLILSGETDEAAAFATNIVAAHDCPSKALRVFARCYPTAQLCVHIVKHPNCDDTVIDAAIIGQRQTVERGQRLSTHAMWKAVVERPVLQARHMAHIAEHVTSQDVLRKLARRDDLDAKSEELLALDEDRLIQLDLVRRDTVRDTTLERLSVFGAPEVRETIAAHHKTPASVLVNLCSDHLNSVIGAAHRNLAQRGAISYDI